jgi:hypothetical protein
MRAVWQYPSVPLRVPCIFNLRRDHCERATITSYSCYDWRLDQACFLVSAQAGVANSSLPPRSVRRGRKRQASVLSRCWGNWKRRPDPIDQGCSVPVSYAVSVAPS